MIFQREKGNYDQTQYLKIFTDMKRVLYYADGREEGKNDIGYELRRLIWEVSAFS